MLCKLVGGRSSMVESKLVELVVAGSNPVGHPTSFFDFGFLDFWKTFQRTTPFCFHS
jgi:hypothetical protein